jgi:hypothetical protein
MDLPIITSPTHHLNTFASMNIHAGIALGSIKEDSHFACTRFEGADRNNFWPFKSFTPSPPTEHTLHCSTPEDIVNSISRELDLEYMVDQKSFTWSYPIATTAAQRVAFDAADKNSHNHCDAFLSACHFGDRNRQDSAEVLFIDLTPGQVAVMVMRGVIHSGQWTSKEPGKTVSLGELDGMSIEKFEEIVALVAPNLSILRCVAILRPEGAFPELLSIKVELKFINIPVQWLSLADLSYGSAMLLYRQLGLKFRSFRCGGCFSSPNPCYIQLADGNLVNIAPDDLYTHSKVWNFFTTSKDEQVTATLRFSRWDTTYDELVVEGLTPGPKGGSRIRVMVEHDNVTGEPVATIQELGSNLNAKLTLRVRPKDENEGSVYRYPLVGARISYAQFGIDGVIGELPE